MASFTIYIKNLDKTSFPNRAGKIFSITTHFFSGIILNIKKSLRGVTSDSMKLSKLDYVFLIFILIKLS